MFKTREEMEKHWLDYAGKHLLGRKVVSVRYLTASEVEAVGWEHTRSSTIVIQFDDGTLVFPSADDEGNAPGALFGQSHDGEDLTFPVMSLPPTKEVK